MLPQWATANRERQGALTESRTTIAGDRFYREWLCGAGQGCSGRILERLYIDNCLPLTVELFHQLAFFVLSCKPYRIADFHFNASNAYFSTEIALESGRNRVANESASARLFAEAYTMTTPAIAIKNEIGELIKLQIEM